MNVASSSRIRSGLAWGSCSSRNVEGSIMGAAVIAVPSFETVVRDHSKDHAVTAPTSAGHAHPGSSYTNPMDSTQEPDPDDQETTVALALWAIGDATKLSLSHGDFATEARLALHRGGWTESMVKLRHLIEPAR